MNINSKFLINYFQQVMNDPLTPTIKQDYELPVTATTLGWDPTSRGIQKASLPCFQCFNFENNFHSSQPGFAFVLLEAHI